MSNRYEQTGAEYYHGEVEAINVALGLLDQFDDEYASYQSELKIEHDWNIRLRTENYKLKVALESKNISEKYREKNGDEDVRMDEDVRIVCEGRPRSVATSPFHSPQSSSSNPFL